MFAPFSSGYYVGRLIVEPHDGDEALMQRDQHERVNEQLYATGDGIERLDYPLFMKLWRRHFAVHADEGVPDNTLLIPKRFATQGRTSPLPAVREILLAKPEVVPRLLEWGGDGSDLVVT